MNWTDGETARKNIYKFKLNDIFRTLRVASVDAFLLCMNNELLHHLLPQHIQTQTKEVGLDYSKKKSGDKKNVYFYFMGFCNSRQQSI